MKANSGLARRAVPLALVLLVLGTLRPVLHGQIVVGQVDDFQTSLSGWHSGVPNATPPSLALDVGPAGPGDDAMQITASGAIGPGRALVAFNAAQWGGDYASAGVSSVSIDLKNTGSSELTLRLAIQSTDLTTWFVTDLGYDLPVGSGWQKAQFSLAESDLTRVAGTQSYASAIGNVAQLRILDNPALDFRGASLAGTLLVDNITAVPEPAASAIVLALSALGVTFWLRRFKLPPPPAIHWCSRA